MLSREMMIGWQNKGESKKSKSIGEKDLALCERHTES